MPAGRRRHGVGLGAVAVAVVGAAVVGGVTLCERVFRSDCGERAATMASTLADPLWDVDDEAVRQTGRSLFDQSDDNQHVRVDDVVRDVAVFETGVPGGGHTVTQPVTYRQNARSERIGTVELTCSIANLRLQQAGIVVGGLVLLAALLPWVVRWSRRQHELQRLSFATASVGGSDLAIVTELDGTIFAVSDSLLALLGCTREDLVRRRLDLRGQRPEVPFECGDGRTVDLTIDLARTIRDERLDLVVLFVQDPASEGKLLIRGYDVQRLLGAGGMAQVYLARNQQQGTLHAVKVLRAHAAGHAQRLRREGEALRELCHANVVAVTDVVDSTLGPALVMEYVEGPTLAALIESGPLSFPEIDALARGILSAVAAAHGRRWIHRDLKPTNVLLALAGDRVVPKVADFGLAKLREPDGTAGSTTRQGPGSRLYMSPEQLRGDDADARMDVFALGAVLFELIEGRRAFPTAVEWEQAMKRDRVPGLSRANVPDRMREAVEAALAPNGEQRPRDAGELLDRWTSGEALAEPAFRPETVRRIRSANHVPDEILDSGAHGPEWQQHLDSCPRCRAAAHLARHDLDEEVDEPEALICSDGDLPASTVRRFFGRLEEPTLASFGSVHEALPAAIALHESSPSLRVGLGGSADQVRRLARLAPAGGVLCAPETIDALGSAGDAVDDVRESDPAGRLRRDRGPRDPAARRSTCLAPIASRDTRWTRS